MIFSRIREITITKMTLKLCIQRMLRECLKVESHFDNAFFEEVARNTVAYFKEQDRTMCNNEGFIFKLEHGTLRRGADELMIRAFIDTTAEFCTQYADSLERKRDMSVVEKLFCNMFATSSQFPHWKEMTRDSLTKAFWRTVDARYKSV